MKIYVLRHGQTDWNILKKIQGHTDIELNETGIMQAREAKEKVNQCDIDLIISSPLKRAMKTAQIVNEDKKVPIIYDERIIERGFGRLEGTDSSKKEVFYNRSFWNYTTNLKYEDMETIVELCDRVNSFFEYVKKKYSNKNILIVTHGGTSKAINAYFNGIDEHGDLPDVRFGNCEIKEYEF